ncbi:hypothetical protein HHI36_022182 [Cryptolaemus montrouzieri]|uniref:Uncharacterized protein n=1 Tax=Cryptolaemus montrouzieri TaxID=559131 RepID=A0ABD2MZ17_9CUCU
MEELILFGKIKIGSLLMVPRFVFILFLGQSFTFNARTLNRQIQIVFIIFLSYMMNLLFNTRLTYLLNGLNREHKIVSLEECVDHGLIIGCPRGTAVYFNDTPKMAAYLEDHFFNCDTTYACMERVAFKRDMVTCNSIRRLHYKNIIDGDTGQSLVEKLYPPLYRRLLVMYFRKGHPVFSVFNVNLNRLIQSGITEKIMKKYEKFVEIIEPPLSEAVSLKLAHIVAPLFIWIVGNVISILSFFMEKQITHAEKFTK